MLKVIGAGFGRTGTFSLKVALEQLGFGPCYHMAEVFSHPEHIPLWTAVAEGQPADWEALFAGYQAAVDAPPCLFYEDLMRTYPQAPVILTVRDPEGWYESASSTIFGAPHQDRQLPPHMKGFGEMLGALMRRFAPGGLSEKEQAIAAFERHNREVQERVPEERLLVMDVREGWAPLCRFLEVPVPDGPFPRLNDRQEFQNRDLSAGVSPQ
jgi:hypothetical protein